MDDSKNPSEYILVEPYNLQYARKNLIGNEQNTFDFTCKTIFTGISTGTELGAWQGLPHLRKEVTYPRKIGYMNISRVVKKNKLSSKYNLGDLIYTLNGHSNYLECNDSDVIMKFSANLNLEKYMFTYIYHLAETAIHSLNSIPCYVDKKVKNSIAVVGGGLIGTALCELLALENQEVTLISEYNREFAKSTCVQVKERKSFSKKSDSSEMRDGTFDLVFTTTNSWDDYFLALDLLKIDGKLSILGFPGRTEGIPNRNVLDSDAFYRKRLTIRSLPRTDILHRMVNSQLELNTINESFLNLSKLIDGGSLSVINGSVKVVESSKLEEVYSGLGSRKSKYLSAVLDWAKS